MEFRFSDMFKKSFVAMFSNTARYTILDIVVNIIISFGIGMFIFFIYKKTYQGVLYQKSFNVSLVAMSTVTSLVIMTISGNLVLSLGMVGALSIVRFRTPIKETIDLVFLFWAITVGIANGVSFYHISVIGSILIGVIFIFLSRKEETNLPYLLVIQFSVMSNEDEILKTISSNVMKYKLKSKTINSEFCELTFEVKLSDNESKFLSQLHQKKMLDKATLISFAGDLSTV